MKKTDPSFTEYRASPKPAAAGANPATKSAKITADAKSSPEAKPHAKDVSNDKPKEVGGPKGPEPTRYGDWERDGRCVDF